MTEYQLKNYIYMLYCNDPKLRQLSKEGVLTMQDMWDWQDFVVREAKKDKLITN